MRTDESVVTLIRTDTSSDEEEKTECRTWRICSHADQRNAQHSQSHCDVVCGQVVRRAEEQVDSVIDQWMSCWKSRNTLVLSAPRLHVVPSTGKRGQIQFFRH